MMRYLKLKLSRPMRFAVLIAGFTSLAGCAGSRITLMPDQNGHVGAVTVTSLQGQQHTDQAYSRIDIGSTSAMPSPSQAVDLQSFEKAHRALLDAQPSLPRSFIVNFKFDSMELTPESKKLLPEVVRVVRERIPTEVTVFGYSDASGKPDYNLELSAKRARAVAVLLKEIAPNLPVKVQYFGDKAPLVAVPPGTQEPRNRRAEIFIL
ncbi:OmpA family protein [Delftia sp. HK171]|uniref:OmpA family protein n=1 Tax=Delftia sp. HK171 TaxID=1920191 RepID=UPI0011508CCC|nr:OmpA family protein [Delftia sp. HK171]TQL81178.1 OmpA family protein [Delftia sp. HK171]